MRTCWRHELRCRGIAAHLKPDDFALIPIGARESRTAATCRSRSTRGRAIPSSEGWARLANVLLAPAHHLARSPHRMGNPGTVPLESAPFHD
jgi:hypothetical protein